MFGPAGRAYVYLVYGMHNCLNVVSGPVGAAGAVLVRAVEALEGLEAMVAGRSASLARRGPPSRPADPRRVASGPGLVCAAFSIDRDFNGVDLCDAGAALHLEPAAPRDRPPVAAWGPRIGVAYAGHPWAGLRWRLMDLSSAAISARPPSDAMPSPDADPTPDTDLAPDAGVGG